MIRNVIILVAQNPMNSVLSKPIQFYSCIQRTNIAHTQTYKELYTPAFQYPILRTSLMELQGKIAATK